MGAVKTIFICPKCFSAFSIDDFSSILICPFCDLVVCIEGTEEDEDEKEDEDEEDEKEERKIGGVK